MQARVLRVVPHGYMEAYIPHRYAAYRMPIGCHREFLALPGDALRRLQKSSWLRSPATVPDEEAWLVAGRFQKTTIDVNKPKAEALPSILFLKIRRCCCLSSPW